MTIGEIVSQSAHEADIARMETSGQFGTLNWEHLYFDLSGNEPAITTIKSLSANEYVEQLADGTLVSLDLGDCDTSLMVGKFRVESGTFYSELTGKALAESDESFTVSVEFFSTGLDADDSHDAIYTVKRSLLSK